jgi:hypothetical protein
MTTHHGTDDQTGPPRLAPAPVVMGRFYTRVENSFSRPVPDSGHRSRAAARRVGDDTAVLTGAELVEPFDLRRPGHGAALYLDQAKLHRVDDRRILALRPDAAAAAHLRYTGAPLRVWAAGQFDRLCPIDATRAGCRHAGRVARRDGEGAARSCVASPPIASVT